MAVKDKQCEMCPWCKNFYAINDFHMHRYDATPTMRLCLSEKELKSQGWKLSKDKIWSKK